MTVDILDPATERIRWTTSTTVRLTVTDPAGNTVGSPLSNNGVATLTGRPAGAYRVTMNNNQTGSWDIAVIGPAPGNVVVSGK